MIDGLAIVVSQLARLSGFMQVRMHVGDLAVNRDSAPDRFPIQNMNGLVCFESGITTCTLARFSLNPPSLSLWAVFFDGIFLGYQTGGDNASEISNGLGRFQTEPVYVKKKVRNIQRLCRYYGA